MAVREIWLTDIEERTQQIGHLKLVICSLLFLAGSRAILLLKLAKQQKALQASGCFADKLSMPRGLYQLERRLAFFNNAQLEPWWAKNSWTEKLCEV